MTRGALLFFSRFAWLTFFISIPSRASLIPVDLSTFPQPEPVVKELTGTLASLTGPRLLAPATPLQSALGLEVGAVAALQIAPASFWNLVGGTQSALPSVLLQVQKKLSPLSSLSVHGLVFQGFKIYGGSFAAHFFQPEEGPFITGRFTFSWSQISELMTRNWGLEFVASRDLGFSDPYLGIGGYLLSGTLKLEPLASSLLPTARIFGGVQFKLPLLGAAITLEGEYTTRLSAGLATKVSLQL